jgi:hypothetical protein
LILCLLYIRQKKVQFKYMTLAYLVSVFRQIVE